MSEYACKQVNESVSQSSINAHLQTQT